MNLSSGSSRLMLVCLVLISLVSVSTAIQCYHCNSEFDPRCGDPFDPYSLGIKNCSTEEDQDDHLGGLKASLCRKSIQKVYGKVRIVRGCGFILDPELDDKRCQKRSGTHDVSTIYCSCTGDLCNTAPGSIATNPLVLLLPATMAAILLAKPLSIH